MKKIYLIYLLSLLFIFELYPAKHPVREPLAIGFLSTFGCTLGGGLLSCTIMHDSKESFFVGSAIGAIIGHRWIRPLITAQRWLSHSKKKSGIQKTTTKKSPSKETTKFSEYNKSEQERKNLYFGWSTIGSYAGVASFYGLVFSLASRSNR